MMRSQPSATSDGPRVGDYRLLTKIGEGGMGVVHLAQARDGRRVALKVLRPHIIGDDEARHRLAREVASLRRVTSPRIAEIIDADPWGETPFVATRYVPGLSLHEHIRQEGPITGDDFRWFAAGLAEAVIAVHDVGVLHRDIKPSNVLLEGRSPVLIDFGLARLAEDPRLTMTGWLLGTPGYLAPETLYGDDATTASDVHSWAATVVFAATGQPPFGRGPAMAIMDRVRRGEHDLSAVPSNLLPILRQCLEPDPIDRLDTAALLSALRNPAAPHARAGQDEFTMPYSLLATDDDPTDLLRTDLLRAGQATKSIEDGPTKTSPELWRPLPSGLARIQRGCLLSGLLAAVTVGFALAPYLSLALFCLAVLVIRTISWTAESAGERQRMRGRRRWYDGLLTAMSSPWYVVVATGGTLLLLVWSTSVALVVGLAYLLFNLPLIPGLLFMGGVLAFSLWWGPGSRRVRVPVRKLMVRATRRTWLGWVASGTVAAAILLSAYALLSGGVIWDPQPGPPWRAGTLLGNVIDFL